MKIARLNLSNVYWHWYDVPFTNAYDEVLANPGVDMLAFQAEFIETLRMTVGGHQFSPVNTMSPAAYFRNQGFFNLMYYFDAIWGPTDDSLSDYRGNLEDARWLEKLLAEALTEHLDWRLPSWNSSQPDRYVTNAANVDCQDFVISLMTGTHPQAKSMAGVPLLYLDDMNLYRMSQAEMDGWERIIKEVQATGQRVILNAGWNMKNWIDRDSDEWNRPEDGASWYYPAAEWLEDGSGVMCEYLVDVDHLTGMSTTSGWWELTQSRFEKMAGDMHDMGIDVYMVVRWTEDEGQDYETFMRPMADLCQSVGAIFCPSKYNYIDDPWSEWMVEYQDDKTFEQTLIDMANDSQVMSLNPYAALQRAMIDADFCPVGNEFKMTWDGQTFIVQKADPLEIFSGGILPNPRAYYVPDGEWDKVTFIEIPR